MKLVHSLSRGMGRVLGWICVVLFIGLIADVTLQVVQRQMLVPWGILEHGFPWTEPVGRYLFVWLSLLGAAYVIGENDDVAIDFLVRKFPPVVGKVVECVAHGVVAFFAIWVMIYGGSRYISSTWDMKIELLPAGLTKGMLYTVLAISGALIAIYSVFHIIETIGRTNQVVDEEDIDITTLTEESI